MGVLELTVLRTPPSPTAPDRKAITKALQQVRTLLAEKVHRTDSKFYIRLEETEETGEEAERKPLDIYILGTWPTIDQHVAFLNNAALREEVLGPQEGMLDFVSGSHYAPLHRSSSFSMLALPIDSPIMVLTLFSVPRPARLTNFLRLQGVVDRFDMLPSFSRSDFPLHLENDETGEPEIFEKARTLMASAWNSVHEYREWLGGWEGRYESVRDGVEMVILEDLEEGDSEEDD